MFSRKKQVSYTLVTLSLGLNFFLLVNVLAMKMCSKNTKQYHDYSYCKESFQKTPDFVTSSTKVEPSQDKNLFDTNCGIAKMYEEKAEKESNPNLKNSFYSVALTEYAKLPKNNPDYAKLVKEARERLHAKMLGDSSLLIDLGASRQQMEKAYGQSPIQRANEKYLPTGIVSNEYYKQAGITFGLSNNQVYEIKLCSNFNGTWHGVRIGDSFDKIAMLYPGRKIKVPGLNFGYEVKDLNTTFIFVDKDKSLDGMRITDTKLFGNWALALK